MRTAGVIMALLGGSCAGVFDPILFQSKTERRNMDCLRLSQEEGAERYPGQIPPKGGRALAGFQPDVMACSTRYLQPADRNARDEAILSTLSLQVTELVESAGALAPRSARWHVDAFYPSLAVAQKIAVTARTTLAERGFSVSDRVPTLAAGDVAVLASLPPSEAYRTACARSFETKVLGPDELFLGLMIVDARETRLHAGLCEGGVWRWLP